MMKTQDLKRASKVRDLSVEELKREEHEITDQLMKLRFQLASGQIENPKIIKAYKLGLARVKTIMAEKRRAAQQGN
jgi:large subunit ribosomal protein L29